MSLEGFLFLIAALLCFGGGLAHSVLGERYIVSRLSRCSDLPILFGSTNATVRIIRIVWHLAAIAWLAIAALLFLMAQGPLATTTVSGVLAMMFLVSAIGAVAVSRGRYLGWPAFVAISAITFWGAYAL